MPAVVRVQLEDPARRDHPRRRCRPARSAGRKSEPNPTGAAPCSCSQSGGGIGKTTSSPGCRSAVLPDGPPGTVIRFRARLRRPGATEVTIKSDDSFRQRIFEFLQAWYAQHGSTPIKLRDLDAKVSALLGGSRQQLATFVPNLGNVGTSGLDPDLLFFVPVKFRGEITKKPIAQAFDRKSMLEKPKDPTRSLFFSPLTGNFNETDRDGAAFTTTLPP